jgi:hypothetical protein
MKQQKKDKEFGRKKAISRGMQNMRYNFIRRKCAMSSLVEKEKRN